MSTGPFTPSRQVLTSLSAQVAAEVARVTVRWGRIHDLLALLAILTTGTVFDDYQVMHPLAPSQVRRVSLSGLGGLFRRLQNTLMPFCEPAVGARLASFAALAELFLALIPARQEYEANVRSLLPTELATASSA
jgi:hypothetical protein